MYWILRNNTVTCNDYKFFFQCLCHKKSVEWIPVNGWQRLYSLKMRYVNCDALKPCQLALFVQVRQGQLRVEFSKGLLDCYFPK